MFKKGTKIDRRKPLIFQHLIFAVWVFKKDFLFERCYTAQMTKRVAIYARVSTADKDQKPETQLLPLREYVKRRGFKIVHELVDEASGRSTSRRPNFKRLLELAQSREIDVVLVFRYSRFARSVKALVDALDTFRSLGIDFISLKDGADTTTPQGKFLFTVMAGLTEMESEIISENVKAGMARAVAHGKHVGRPNKADENNKVLAKHYQRGICTVRPLAKAAGVSIGTAHSFIKKQSR